MSTENTSNSCHETSMSNDNKPTAPLNYLPKLREEPSTTTTNVPYPKVITSCDPNMSTLSSMFKRNVSISPSSTTCCTPKGMSSSSTTLQQHSSNTTNDVPLSSSFTTTMTSQEEQTRKEAHHFSKAVQQAKVALEECGSSPTLAPILAFLQQSRQQQEALERTRLLWDYNQKTIDRQLSERQHLETVAAVKYDPNWTEKLTRVHGNCWNAVSRLVFEVGLIHRLYEIVRPLKYMWRQGIKDVTPRVLIKAIAAMVRI